MARLGDQAAALGASGIVGVSITHGARRHSLSGGMAVSARGGLMVTFNALGTAIRQVATPPLPPPRMTVDMTS
jgi:uncharacterized protein YbjQ (UPF0145 family)